MYMCMYMYMYGYVFGFRASEILEGLLSRVRRVRIPVGLGIYREGDLKFWKLPYGSEPNMFCPS